MRKTLFLAIVLLFTIQCTFAQSYSKFFGIANQDTVNFVFTIRNPDIKAIDCHPQQITDISKTGDNYKIALTSINPYLSGERFTKMKEAEYNKSQKYEREIAKYLLSTPLIDTNNDQIREIADTLFRDETKTLAIIQKGLVFVHSFLSASDSIAKLIDAGTCRTIDVNTVLQTRKGTCSEYTNLFTALMRYMNIPTRFAVGYCNVPEWKMESTHAWPECYIDGIGWCSVDPTLPSPIYVHFGAIRLRYGLDYEDCNIRTLGHDIEPIEFTKVK